MKKILLAVLLTVLMSVASVSVQGPAGGPNGQRGGNRGGNGGGVDKSSDAELQKMITEIIPQFELVTWEDPETGITLQYQLFIPADYNANEKYPLVQFIPDSSVVGKGTDAVLTQGWGGLIWASDEEQSKHPCFVVVPVFTDTVVDDNFNHSEQIEADVHFIQYLLQTYSIDPEKLYTTGQSMGGMTSFYLNITYPDLFAASIFVGSQWDNSNLNILEDKSFFYIVSAGDPKASAGQSELLAVFDADGAAYSHDEWGAQDPAEEQNASTVELGVLGDGNHTIAIVLTDNAGNEYDSRNDPSIGTISFIADITPPTAALSKPDNNSYVNGEISVAGTAGDNIGLSKVVYYIDGTAAGETSVSGTSASFSKVLNTANLPEGKHTLSVVAVDRAGNESAPVKKTFTVDHTYPVNDIEITGSISGGWYYGPVTITSVAQDTYLDRQWVDAGFGQKENADTIPATFSGTVTPKSKSVDLAGNLSDWTAFEPIRIDNEKPVITNFIDPKGKWFNYPVPLSVSGTDQYSGVRTGYIVVDGKTMDVNGNTSSLAFSGSQGMHEVKYQLEDFASNRSAVSGPYSFGFDTILPEIKLDSNQSFDIIGPVVTISGTVTDNASGIKNIEIKYGTNGTWKNVSGQPSSGTLDGSWSQNIAQDVAEGYNNFFVRTTDIAGNVSQVVTFTLRTDKTPPETVGLRIEGQKGPGDAYRGKVTFIGEAEDSVAGVKSIFVDLGLGEGEKPNSDSVAAGYSGVVTACVRAVDNVGNSTECIPQDPVTVDNEKPYPTDYTRLDPTVVYKGSDVFSVTGADDLSGMYSASILLDSTPFTALGESVSVELGALGNGTHTISFVLTDNAGNVYDSKDDPNVGIITFSVDSESPEVVLSKPEDGEYVNRSVTAEGTASDNIGLAKIEYLIDGSKTAEETLSGTGASFSKELDTAGLQDGTHTVSVIVTDKAGNQSDPVQKSFIVDHTPPACYIEVYGTRGDGGSFRGQVTLKAVCTDDGSGVDETYINTGDERVPSEKVIPDGFTGSVAPLVAGIDNAGNDSGDLEGDMILMPDGTPVTTILVDNTPPVVTGYYEPSSKWLNIETIDLFVTGHDNEGPLYSGTIILNGKPYDIRTESDKAELTAEIPEGISSLKYYVTDLAGNRSEIIGK